MDADKRMMTMANWARDLAIDMLDGMEVAAVIADIRGHVRVMRDERQLDREHGVQLRDLGGEG